MLKNFVLESANAPGTSSSVSLAGAATGRVSFAQVFATGAAVFYYMSDGTQAEWGVGTLTIGSPNTLARTQVIGNTVGSTARLNFAGTTDVYNEVPAENTLYVDGGGVVRATGATTVDPLLGTTPVGAGMDFWGDTAPTGWIFPYGQTLSRTTYAALYAVFGTKYGAGDGTTFGVPDKRDRASIGKGDMGGTAAGRITAGGAGLDTTTLGAAGGDQMAQAHAHAASSAPHTHTDSGHNHADAGHTHTMFDQSGSGGGSGSGSRFVAVTIASNATGAKGTDTAMAAIQPASANIQAATASVTVDSAGAGASQNLPPGIVCNYIIFAGA